MLHMLIVCTITMRLRVPLAVINQQRLICAPVLAWHHWHHWHSSKTPC
jgi:hypothetical protein